MIIVVVQLAITIAQLLIQSKNISNLQNDQVTVEEMPTIEELLEIIENTSDSKKEQYAEPIKPQKELSNREVITEVSETVGSRTTTYYIGYTENGLISQVRLYETDMHLNDLNQPEYSTLQDIIYKYEYEKETNKLIQIQRMVIENNTGYTIEPGYLDIAYSNNNKTIDIIGNGGSQFEFSGDATELVSHIPINFIDKALGWYKLNKDTLLLKYTNQEAQSIEYNYNDDLTEIEIVKNDGENTYTSKINMTENGYTYYEDSNNTNKYIEYNRTNDSLLAKYVDNENTYETEYTITKMTFDEIYYNQLYNYVYLIQHNQNTEQEKQTEVEDTSSQYINIQ